MDGVVPERGGLRVGLFIRLYSAVRVRQLIYYLVEWMVKVCGKGIENHLASNSVSLMNWR